jgi:hypothetical protein
MVLSRPLSPEEDAALSSILEEISRRAHHGRVFSLDELVDSWARFGGEVEQGYKFSIYDYCNDLSVRDLLAEIVARVPESLAVNIREFVADLDNVFFSVTQPAQVSVGSGVGDFPGAWWFRVPQKLCEELRGDLLAAGIIVNSVLDQCEEEET